MLATVDLVQALEQFHLLEPAQLALVRQRVEQYPQEPAAFLKQLVHEHCLTAFQAEMLLLGRGRELLVGSYVLLDRLGQGGMGTVYKARQWKFDRLVALKLMRAERLADEVAIQRFRREIRASAKLDHPNIIRAYDADEVSGVHFFTMEYVEGVDLARLVKDRGPLPIASAVDYIGQAACGLAHAHEHGMVHRDIKPPNLLVTHGAQRNSARGKGPIAHAAGSSEVVKILDFGLARLDTRDGDEASSMLTSTGMVMGTPDFLAPEQTRDAKSVDIRADLYSLGCALYFLLTGRVPFPGDNLAEKLVKHQLDEPTPVEALRCDVPPRVAAITRKLMAKRREDRLQTPAEVAAALSDPALLEHGVHQSHETYESHGMSRETMLPSEPPDLADSFAGFQRRRPEGQAVRHKLLVAISIGVPAVLGTAVALWLLSRGTAEHSPTKPAAQARPLSKPAAPTRPTAPSAEQLDEQARKQRDSDAEKALPDLEVKFKAGDVTFESFVKEVAAFKAKHCGTQAATRAARLLTMLPSPLDALKSEKIPHDCTAFWRAEGREPPLELIGVLGEHTQRHWGAVICLAFSPDGKLLASSGTDRAIRLWDADDLRYLGSLTDSGPLHPYYHDLVFLAGGRQLVTAADDARVQLFDVTSRHAIKTLGTHTMGATSLAVSPDERWVLSGSAPQLRLWDTTGAESMRDLKGHQGYIYGLAVSCTGTQGLSACTDGTIRWWDLRDGKELALLQGFSVRGGVAFLADHPCALTQSDRLTLTFHRLDRDDRPIVFKGHTGFINCARLSRDGRRLYTAADDETIRVWEVSSGREIFQIKQTPAPIPDIALSPDETRLATGGMDGTVRLWDVATGKEVQPLTHRAGRVGAALTPDCRQLLTTGPDLCVWDLTTLKAIRRVDAIAFRTLAVAVSPDGGRFLTGSNWPGDTFLRLHDLSTEVPIRQFKHPNWVVSTAFSPDGRRALAAGTFPEVRLWDLETGELHKALEVDLNTSAVFSGDGRYVLSMPFDQGRDILWDAETGRELGPLGTAGQSVHVAVFAPGEAVAYYAVANRIIAARLKGASVVDRVPFDDVIGRVTRLAIAADGRFLAAIMDQAGVCVWDVKQRTRIKSWTFPGPVDSLLFAEDGRHLVTANANGTVYFLRLFPVATTSDSPIE